jgi:hypothetical protein
MVMLHELEHLPNTFNHIQHPPQCLLLAQSGHAWRFNECPLSGGKADMMRTRLLMTPERRFATAVSE